MGNGGEAGRRLADAVRAVVEFLAPPRCVRCGRGVDGGGDRGGPRALEGRVALLPGVTVALRPLCDGCRRGLVPAPAAGVLGWGWRGGTVVTPGGVRFGPRLPRGGSRRRRVAVVAPYRSTGAVVSVVREAKFARRPALLDAAAAAIASTLAGPARRPGTVLVPVPMHPRARRRRGIDHAAVLAEGVGRRVGLPVLRGALRRVREGTQQSRTPHDRRAGNVRGAFAPGPAAGAIGGRWVVIVDDLVTTGSTAAASAAAALGAGAEGVTVACLARGL